MRSRFKLLLLEGYRSHRRVIECVVRRVGAGCCRIDPGVVRHDVTTNWVEEGMNVTSSQRLIHSYRTLYHRHSAE